MAAWDQDLDQATRPAQAPAARPAWERDLDPPAAVKVGRGLMDIPRQVGLTARYGMEGLGQLVEIGSEPLRQFVTDPIIRKVTGAGQPTLSTLITGPTAPPRSKSAGQMATSAADWIGLPKPENANERVVGDVTRLMAGAGGLSGAGRVVSGAPGMMGKVGEFFAASPGLQITSAAGAGAAGGSVREAGGGPVAQAVASLAGGLAAPAAVSGAQGMANRVSQAFAPKQTMQQVDQQIDLVLRQQGVDWSQVPERLRQGLRTEAQAALDTGADLNGQALARLLDFRRVEGATPTRGTVSLDPVLITREKNLAKTGANSTDVSMQRLAQVENANNRALIDNINRVGAAGAPDKGATGERLISSLQRNLDADQTNINSLYSAARDSSGRSFPLDGASFATRANKALDDGLLGGSLPPSVAEHMNRVARGEVPFTVDYAEQLKTAIGNLQRASTDGNTRRALGVVRQAIDDTPVLGLGQQGPAAGARPNNPGQLPAVPNDPGLGQQSVEAFNRARAANRAMMQRVEEVPALAAVREGVEPDKFVQRFITGEGPEASVRAVQALRREIANDPQALAAVRGNIADFLKQKALNGQADEVGNFSASNFKKAIDGIGERKLRAFFSPEEIEQLNSISRVSSYMAVQPKGSAVNNSNSGAMLVGRGLDFLDQVAGRLPVGQDTVRGFVRGVQQRQALDISQALSLTGSQVRAPRLQPAAMATGLFLAPSAPRAEDDRRP